MMLITLLGIVAFPLYFLGTAAEPSDQVLPESVGQGVRTLSYIASARSYYIILNAISRLWIPLLFVLPVVATFHLLSGTARKALVLATASAGVSIIGSIALAQVGNSLVGLSDQFALASNEVEKAAIAASAISLVGVLGLGEVFSGILFFSWMLITSLLFRSRNLLGRRLPILGLFAALVGPLYGSITILATIVSMSWSAFFFSYLIFTPLFLVLLVWSSFMGYKLYKMDSQRHV